MRIVLFKTLIVFGLFFTPAMSYAEDERDPWEGWNRNVHEFNEVLDRYVARPVAKGYQFILPQFVRTGIGNFFSNLGEIPTAINDLLQAKPVDAIAASGRFVINSTVGIVGLFDVASWMGIREHKEDIGQTLAVWGVGSGPYLVLPILGPSTFRDAFSLYPDTLLDPLTYAPISTEEGYGIRALDLIHSRHLLLSQESLIQGDKYIFYRDAYLQNRHYEIVDGQIEDEFDSSFDDIELDEDF